MNRNKNFYGLNYDVFYWIIYYIIYIIYIYYIFDSVECVFFLWEGLDIWIYFVCRICIKIKFNLKVVFLKLINWIILFNFVGDIFMKIWKWLFEW